MSVLPLDSFPHTEHTQALLSSIWYIIDAISASKSSINNENILNFLLWKGMSSTDVYS